MIREPSIMNTSRLTLLASTCLAGLLLGSAVQAADPYRVQSQGSVIGDDVLYSVGGGNAVPMGSVGNMDSIQIGGGWNTNLICGNMSLTNTLQNQLNGATQGFQTIMSSVLQNATGAVASLSAQDRPCPPSVDIRCPQKKGSPFHRRTGSVHRPRTDGFDRAGLGRRR